MFPASRSSRGVVSCVALGLPGHPPKGAVPRYPPRGVWRDWSRPVPGSCRGVVSPLTGGFPHSYVFSSFNVGDLLSKWERFRMLAHDPLAGARYFRRLTDIVVDVLARWCSARGRPLARGGVFGRCRGFYGEIEAHARGSPHIHMLIWLLGHAPSAKEFSSLLRGNKRFRDSWWAWAKVLVHADLQTSAEVVSCPKCSSPVRTVSVPTSCHGVQPRAAVPPFVATCVRPTCDGTLTSAPVVRQQQCRAAGISGKAAAAAHDDADSAHSTPAAAAGRAAASPFGDETPEQLLGGDTLDAMLATPTLPDWTAAAGHPQHGRVYESALAMATQMHSHRHSASCFKRTRSGRPRECRSGFPREPRVTAEIDKEGGFLVRRPVGCEYVNPNVRLMLVFLRCNTEFRFMQVHNSVLYTVKYVLKPMAEDQRDAIQMINRFQRVLSAEQTVELVNFSSPGQSHQSCGVVGF